MRFLILIAALAITLSETNAQDQFVRTHPTAIGLSSEIVRLCPKIWTVLDITPEQDLAIQSLWEEKVGNRKSAPPEEKTCGEREFNGERNKILTETQRERIKLFNQTAKTIIQTTPGEGLSPKEKYEERQKAFSAVLPNIVTPAELEALQTASPQK